MVDPQEESTQLYYFAVGRVATDPPSITRKNSQAVAGEWEFKGWIDRDHVGLTIMTATPNCPAPECDGRLTRLAKGWKLELLPPKKLPTSCPDGSAPLVRCIPRSTAETA